MRRLLGDVVGAGVVGQVPITGEHFAKDRVKRLLDTPMTIR